MEECNALAQIINSLLEAQVQIYIHQQKLLSNLSANEL